MYACVRVLRLLFPNQTGKGPCCLLFSMFFFLSLYACLFITRATPHEVYTLIQHTSCKPPGTQTFNLQKYVLNVSIACCGVKSVFVTLRFLNKVSFEPKVPFNWRHTHSNVKSLNYYVNNHCTHLLLISLHGTFSFLLSFFLLLYIYLCGDWRFRFFVWKRSYM